MRILHCCLANFYIDDYGYQENILTKIHRLQGHEVAILASTETYVDGKNLGYVSPSSYVSSDGIPVTRFAYWKGLPHPITRKLRIYPGVAQAVAEFGPDIIFLHGCQFLSIRAFAEYARTHPDVRLYVDGHTDLMNSARDWVSRHILHGIIYKYCAKVIEPYARKFYGVLPVRVSFFEQVYGISPSKTALLVLGADDTKFDLSQKNRIRKALRQELAIEEDDFLLVTGGKLDKRKNIHHLMEAVREIPLPKIRLVLFGRPSDEMEDIITSLSRHERIRWVGWIPADKAYDYFMAADLAVFPGTHSVLWEQSVGVGLPCVFRRWDGIQHVDLGGNCLFLEKGDVAEITQAITTVYNDKELYARMRDISMEKGIAFFSYKSIADRAIRE